MIVITNSDTAIKALSFSADALSTNILLHAYCGNYSGDSVTIVDSIRPHTTHCEGEAGSHELREAINSSFPHGLPAPQGWSEAGGPTI